MKIVSEGRDRRRHAAADPDPPQGVQRGGHAEPERRLSSLTRLRHSVGGIGIAPGANLNYDTGVALFEATHGTAPKYADQDKVNPGSVILSGEMMFRYLGWEDAADLIVKGINGAISKKTVTYDFERLMEGATLLKCSEFGQAVVDSM